jgi:uncharacterized membrane protein YhaH (DUF805 family)
MKWFIKVLKQYADFSGRAQRKEYWIFTLVNSVVLFGLLYLSSLFVWSGPFALPEFSAEFKVFGVIFLLYWAIMIIPTFAVTVRRLHDSGRSGWWIFISLVPYIGNLWLLVLMCFDGDVGRNQYGADPKKNDVLPEYQLSNNCALLHIYRPNSMKGIKISYNLHLKNKADDKIVFHAWNRNKMTVKITDVGEQTLWARVAIKEKLKIDTQLGHEYFVRCGVGFDFLEHPKLELVDNQMGKAEFDRVIL